MSYSHISLWAKRKWSQVLQLSELLADPGSTSTNTFSPVIRFLDFSMHIALCYFLTLATQFPGNIWNNTSELVFDQATSSALFLWKWLISTLGFEVSAHRHVCFRSLHQERGHVSAENLQTVLTSGPERANEALLVRACSLTSSSNSGHYWWLKVNSKAPQTQNFKLSLTVFNGGSTALVLSTGTCENYPEGVHEHQGLAFSLPTHLPSEFPSNWFGVKSTYHLKHLSYTAWIEGDILSMIMVLWLCFQKGVFVNGKTGLKKKSLFS